MRRASPLIGTNWTFHMRSTLVPEVVNLHITSVCNLHCKYCFGQFPEISRPPPKTDWRAFDAMSEEDHHRAALSDFDCPPASEVQLARARRVLTVRACVRS